MTSRYIARIVAKSGREKQPPVAMPGNPPRVRAFCELVADWMAERAVETWASAPEKSDGGQRHRRRKRRKAGFVIQGKGARPRSENASCR